MKKNTIISLFVALSLFGFSNNSNSQTKSFDGPYVGVSMGKTRNDSISHSGSYYSDYMGNFDVTIGESKSVNDSTRSIKLGYTTRVSGSNTVIGVEVAKTYLDATINSEGDIYGDAGTGGGIASTLNIGNYSTLTARIGQALNDKTLVSFNAGVARSKISQSNVRDPLDDARQSDTSSATEYGFVYGLSGEYKITPQLSLRADYEVVDFGDVSRTMVNGQDGVFYDNNKIKFDNVSIGLVYSF